jgi:hypothetical protein
MMYLPEHRLSIVLMINAFKNKCLNQITEDLVSISTGNCLADAEQQNAKPQRR